MKVVSVAREGKYSLDEHAKGQGHRNIVPVRYNQHNGIKLNYKAESKWYYKPSNKPEIK